MISPTYELYGLRIRSEVPLPAALSASDSFDVEVVWGERRPVPAEAPSGVVVASYSFSSDFGYTHTVQDSGYCLRYHGVGEFWMDHQLKAIRVHLAPGQDAEQAPLLLVGNVIATLLTLAGDCVLHASAVERRGSAMAFVGHSGMGKSTLAALACAAGARLVTDDLLRVTFGGEGAHCYRGTSAIRLRSGAAAICADWPEGSCRSTVDDRRLVEVKPCADACPPLSAIIMPKRSQSALDLSMTPLPTARAIYELSAYPRVAGWRSREVISRQFLLLGRLAGKVPVHEATIPWGPPFAPDLGNRLLDGVFGCTKAAS